VPAESTGDPQPSSREQVQANTSQLAWRHSSRCGEQGACVEIADGPDGGIAIRDGKLQRDSPVLVFGPEEWDDFKGAVRSGELD
jgi:Domain of unknown function (DUF397)